jgi:phosphoenolpyruvate synthase/pyruvate phosphate dikinase
MQSNQYFQSLRARRIKPSAGHKALNLHLLMKKGLRIPDAHVCDWSAYHLYIENEPEIISLIKKELSRFLDVEKLYAVRSSANIEDSLDKSFAGQFKSILNVQGIDNIIEAIRSIWDSTTSPAVETYLKRLGIPSTQLSMAVIIQEMVSAKAAGVALSRNPVNGADEIIVEAVQGTGDALVQSGITPFRWVNKWGNWLSKPETEAIPLCLVDEIVHLTRKIAEILKSHIDLEWAWDGKELYWLQVREITALQQRNVYSNYMSKEMLPGMIKPLVWSVNIPMKSVVFVKFMNELLGETGINPEELIKSFYYRVYFNMGVIGQAFKKLGLPADSVEMMSGHAPMAGKMMKPTLQMLLHLPHMLAFVHDKWTFHKKMRELLPNLDNRIKSIKWREASQLDIKELFTATDQLYELVQEVTYYNILCPILSVMHNRMFSRELNRLGVDLSQFDVAEGLPEITEYDPDTHLRRLHEAFENLDPINKEEIRRGKYASLELMDGVRQFHKDVDAFIERFGYLSDNGNDFSCPPWRENCDMVLDMIFDFKTSQDKNTAKIHFSDLKVNFLRQPMVKAFFERVQVYRLLREQLSSHYTYTYGLFRYYYLAMGEYLVQGKIIDTAADIFYMAKKDVEQAIAGNTPDQDQRILITRHKADMNKFKDIALPGIIYGNEEPPIADQTNERLYGMATSLGTYTGSVRVVHGIADFDKVRDGDVLIIPYSDVGWAPLFARAGAVVAESGGLLSHSSIIAREYGIPAVVSVNGAMRLIDNMRVIVDGHRGEVVILPIE